MKKIQPILSFLEGKEFAMAGVSRDKKKFGGALFADLMNRGYKVYPVNPHTDKIGDVTCYPDVASLPEQVKKLYIVTPKKETLSVVEQAVKKGIRQIWIQQMSETPEAVKLAQEKTVDPVYGECMHMYAEPVESLHKFHRAIRKFFGRFPK